MKVRDVQPGRRFLMRDGWLVTVKMITGRGSRRCVHTIEGAWAGTVRRFAANVVSEQLTLPGFEDSKR